MNLNKLKINWFLQSKILKFEVESSDLRLEIGKLLADVEEGQEKLRTCEGEKADLVTSKLSLENEIKVRSDICISVFIKLYSNYLVA